MQWRSVRPSGDTARYATVVMAAPPSPTRRWKSTRASVTAPRGEAPSKVAALMKRFLSVSGPSRADSKGVNASPVALVRRALDAAAHDGEVVGCDDESVGPSHRAGELGEHVVGDLHHRPADVAQ